MNPTKCTRCKTIVETPGKKQCNRCRRNSVLSVQKHRSRNLICKCCGKIHPKETKYEGKPNAWGPKGPRSRRWKEIE